VGVSRDCPNFWSTPIISGMREATNFKFGTCSYGRGPSEQKPLKNLGEKSAWAYRLPKFFEYPLLCQERVKLRTSNLADVFSASMQTKPLNYLGERECGRIQGLP